MASDGDHQQSDPATASGEANRPSRKSLGGHRVLQKVGANRKAAKLPTIAEHRVKAKAGPRHLVFQRRTKFVYLLDELTPRSTPFRGMARPAR